MIRQFFLNIYVSSIPITLMAMVGLLFVYSILETIIGSKMSRIGFVTVLLSVIAILYSTVLSRSNGVYKSDFIPLSSFQRANVQPEIYREMLMNVLLFVPLGMSLVYMFSGEVKKRMLLTVIIGFLLSITIETIQYYGHLGMAETDDVICNTLGTLIGSCAYPLSLFWRRIIDRIRKGKVNG